ncbi:hypothetical protein [Brevibacillus centrosporus]|uniref:hypothetical protein n=1 Tax=Brevibacillus centrosporus TaxID=54910 RepID=UPI001586F9CE|nr:hypothetical protein [Brevibacillus centrosporus]
MGAMTLPRAAGSIIVWITTPNGMRHGDIEWMHADPRDLIRELYVQMTLYQLKPVTIVNYERGLHLHRRHRRASQAGCHHQRAGGNVRGRCRHQRREGRECRLSDKREPNLAFRGANGRLGMGLVTRCGGN